MGPGIDSADGTVGTLVTSSGGAATVRGDLGGAGEDFASHFFQIGFDRVKQGYKIGGSQGFT